MKKLLTTLVIRTEFLKAILVDSGLWQRDFEAIERG